MAYPKFLYHVSEAAHYRCGQYPTYPIRVDSDEALAALEPGWHEDPVIAAKFGTDQFVPMGTDADLSEAAEKALAEYAAEEIAASIRADVAARKAAAEAEKTEATENALKNSADALQKEIDAEIASRMASL